MSQWCWLVLAICVSGALGFQFGPDVIAFKNATWEKCQKQENVPDGPMRDLYNYKTAEGVKDYKCVTKCLFEEFGFLTKDGQLSEPNIYDSLKALFKDQEMDKELIMIGAECVAEEPLTSDLCEYTYDIVTCLMDVLNKLGINLEEEEIN